MEQKHEQKMSLIKLVDNAFKRFIDANTLIKEKWTFLPFQLGKEN